MVQYIKFLLLGLEKRNGGLRRSPSREIFTKSHGKAWQDGESNSAHCIAGRTGIKKVHPGTGHGRRGLLLPQAPKHLLTDFILPCAPACVVKGLLRRAGAADPSQSEK